MKARRDSFGIADNYDYPLKTKKKPNTWVKQARRITIIPELTTPYEKTAKKAIDSVMRVARKAKQSRGSDENCHKLEDYYIKSMQRFAKGYLKDHVQGRAYIKSARMGAEFDGRREAAKALWSSITKGETPEETRKLMMAVKILSHHVLREDPLTGQKLAELKNATQIRQVSW